MGLNTRQPILKTEKSEIRHQRGNLKQILKMLKRKSVSFIKSTLRSQQRHQNLPAVMNIIQKLCISPIQNKKL